LAPDRWFDDRPLALHDVEVDPQAGEGGEDVGKEDHAIGVEGVERLHGDLVGEIGVFGALPEAWVPIPKVAIHLHVAAGLTHHPHRWPLHRFPAGGTQQEGKRFGHGSGETGTEEVGNLAERAPGPLSIGEDPPCP